jgi:long-chain acyl-CoA synthetase
LVCGVNATGAGAAIFPILPALRALAQGIGVSGDDAVLCRDAKVRQAYRKIVEDACSMLPDFEKVKVFTLIPTPLTVDGGELTPTMKVKRGVVSHRFRDDLGAMFVAPRGGA